MSESFSSKIDALLKIFAWIIPDYPEKEMRQLNRQQAEYSVFAGGSPPPKPKNQGWN
jgi:hypothetical protein